MRFLTIIFAAAGVAALTSAAALLGQTSSRSTVESGTTRAVEDDGRLSERERQAEDRRLQDELRKLRAGKTSVVKVGTLTVGTRELVAVTATRDEATVVLLIPQVRRSRYQKWETPVALAAAVRAMRPGQYEVIHTEEAHGLEWITGIGEDSPKTLEDMEKVALGRTFTPAEPEASKDNEATEPAEGTAVGKFVELIEGEIDGKTYKAIVMQRGTMMTRTELWLAKPRSRGGLTAHRSNVLDEAAALKAGDMITVKYVKVGDRLCVTEFTKD